MNSDRFAAPDGNTYRLVAAADTSCKGCAFAPAVYRTRDGCLTAPNCGTRVWIKEEKQEQPR